MKPILLLIAFVVLNSSTSAQLSPVQREININNYIKNRKQNVPPYILDSLLEGYQKGLSGNSVKEGKIAASSLSVDEKGASAQIALRSFDLKNLSIFPGLNFSGRGDDKFVNIFKEGKYQNNLAGGVLLNIFPSLGSAKFWPSDRAITKAQVKGLQTSYNQPNATDPFDANPQMTYLNPLMQSLVKYEEANVEYHKNKKEDAFENVSKEIENAFKGRDTLISLGLLPQNYARLTSSKRLELIKALWVDSTISGKLRRQNYLNKVQQVLMESRWTSVALKWFTIKINYNVTPQPIIDLTNTKDNYLTSYNDKYLTWSISYNTTRRYHNKSEFQHTLSPTVSFSRARDFSDLKKIILTNTEVYSVINGDTLTKNLFTSEGFETIAARRLAWLFEVPLILFWSKSNIGLDIAVRGGQNNPNRDNYGGRIGVYIPVEVKEGTPIWIEPILRVGKLFEKQSAKEEQFKFWRDNVVVGFNLSVALKHITAFKKK